MYSIRSLKTFWCPQAPDQQSTCILGSSHRTVANTPRISQKCSCHNPPQIPTKCTPNAKPINKTYYIWQAIGNTASVEVTQLHPCLCGVSSACRPFQGPAAYCQSLEPWARLKFHAGWSGWTRPPTMAGGGVWGGGWLEVCVQWGVEGVF